MKSIVSRIEQEKNLKYDVEGILSYRKLINDKTNHIFDYTRVLGVVAAGKGANDYLPNTIPQTIKQISAIGLGADIIIGLNNGFECPDVIKKLKSLENVQVILLYTGEKISNNIPAPIFEDADCKGKPYCLSSTRRPLPHRIFIVHQKAGVHSPGKIRVLGDIYDSLLFRSIQHGWIPPATLVAFDAESHFLANDRQAIPQVGSNGLALIIGKLQNDREIDLLGANNRYVVYQPFIVEGTKVFVPDFSAELPPIQWFLNLLHGNYAGYKYKPASCTVGKTDIMISLFAVIAQRYPGARLDDVQLTVLAKNAGFHGDIFMDVTSTNRVPGISDLTADPQLKLAWKEQVYRWIAGLYALESNYGEQYIIPICTAHFPLNVVLNPIKFLNRFRKTEKLNLKNILKKVLLLISAALAFRQIQQKAANEPDILQGSQAKASW